MVFGFVFFGWLVVGCWLVSWLVGWLISWLIGIMYMSFVGLLSDDKVPTDGGVTRCVKKCQISFCFFFFFFFVGGGFWGVYFCWLGGMQMGGGAK